MSDLALKTPEVHRVKELLFGEERKILAEVRDIVTRHEERIGTDESLKHSVAQIIAMALRDAQVQQHEQLAAAISPLVMAGVRREIMNSRAELIDAMHPMMGHMLSAYVTNGLRDFLHVTDRRLESGLSPRRWKLRVRSALTGIPVNELILRDRKILKVVDILLLQRGSGALIDRWQAEPDATPGKGAQNPALLSSMLSAITEFAREAFADGKSELRTLDIGSARVYLRASPAYLIGIKCVGEMSAVSERKIDRVVLRAFEDYAGALAADARNGSAVRRVLPALADRLAEALAPDMSDPAVRTGRLRYLTAVASVFALMGFATAGRYVVQNMQALAKQREIENVIRANDDFKGLAISVSRSRDGNGFVVSGLAPSKEAAEALNRALQDAVEGAPVHLNLATGLLTSTSTLAGDALTVVTQLADSALQTVTSTVGGATRAIDSTTSAVVNFAGQATDPAVRAVDGVTRTAAHTVGGMTQTASAAVTETVDVVANLTRRLGDLERSLTPAAVEQHVERKAAERALADLDSRLDAVKKSVEAKASAIRLNDPEAERVRLEATDLGAAIEAARRRAISGQQGALNLGGLYTRLAAVEVEAATAPVRRQVRALESDLRAVIEAAGGPIRNRADRKPAKTKPEINLAEELNRPLDAASLRPETYSSEAAMRDLTSRVKGSVLGPRINGQPAGASFGPAATAGSPHQNPLGATVSATQNVAGGVAGATGRVVSGGMAATQNLVGGVTNATTGIINGLSGKK
jgi:hypothetical protein